MADVVLADADGVIHQYNGIIGVRLRKASDQTQYEKFDIEGAGTLSALKGTVEGSATSIEEWMLRGITQVRDYAFQRHGGLSSIELPDSVIRIGQYAFQNCTALEDVTFGLGLTEIGQWAFGGSAITEADLSGCPNLTSLGQRIFQDCSSLEQIAFSNQAILTSITNRMLFGCSSLVSATLPTTITTVSYFAFAYCASLPSIVLPSTLTQIQDGAFEGCSSLMRITCLASTPPTLGTDALNGVPANCIIEVPSGSVNSYKTASGWSARASHIQSI